MSKIIMSKMSWVTRPYLHPELMTEAFPIIIGYTSYNILEEIKGRGVVGGMSENECAWTQRSSLEKEQKIR